MTASFYGLKCCPSLLPPAASGGIITILESLRIFSRAYMYYSVSFILSAFFALFSPFTVCDIYSIDLQIPLASYSTFCAFPCPVNICPCLRPSAMFILDCLSPSELRIFDLLILSDSA